MVASDAVWIEKRGTDRDSDRFAFENLVHASGRILAKVRLPLCDEYRYNVAFYCTVPKTVLADQNECFDFIDIDSARAFALAVLASFDPISLVQVAAVASAPTTKPVDGAEVPVTQESAKPDPEA